MRSVFAHTKSSAISSLTAHHDRPTVPCPCRVPAFHSITTQTISFHSVGLHFGSVYKIRFPVIKSKCDGSAVYVTEEVLSSSVIAAAAVAEVIEVAIKKELKIKRILITELRIY